VARHLRLEGLEPWRADGQVDAFALDLGRLGNGAFDFAERGVYGQSQLHQEVCAST
jgi:hypothetical protein